MIVASHAGAGTCWYNASVCATGLISSALPVRAGKGAGAPKRNAAVIGTSSGDSATTARIGTIEHVEAYAAPAAAVAPSEWPATISGAFANVGPSAWAP